MCIHFWTVSFVWSVNELLHFHLNTGEVLSERTVSTR